MSPRWMPVLLSGVVFLAGMALADEPAGQDEPPVRLKKKKPKNDTKPATESGKADEVSAIICEAGVNLLDGEVCEVHGVGFAGVKGFCGGFGAHQLSPWGEPAIKTFVHEAVDEALKLERALGRLETDQRIVLMHYSPIKPTVEGEPPETFPFLGSSRLEEPLTRYPVQAVFHGHAHHGRPEGKAMGNIPVFNVALPLMKKIHADGSAPFRIFEVPVPAAA